MTPRRIMAVLLPAISALLLAGCGGGPSKTVKESIKGIEKGVKGIDSASGNLVGRLFTDRNRAALVREHKETLEHLNLVKKTIKDRKIQTEPADDKLLQDAEDRLSAVGRQLDSARITSEAGMGMYRQLEGVRQSLDLIRKRHNTPRYSGYIADR